MAMRPPCSGKSFRVSALKHETLQKWWTLNLARFSAMDRYTGLTAEETEKELIPLLKIEAPPDKTGAKKTFPVGEFDQYLKRPGIRAILNERHAAIIALGSHANALYRPVIADYEAVFASLSKGRTRGVRDRLAEGERTPLRGYPANNRDRGLPQLVRSHADGLEERYF